MKRLCTSCNAEKSLDNYHRRNNRPNGIFNICKECQKEKSAKRYQANKKQYAKKQAEYKKANKSKVAEWGAKYYAQNSEKVAAKSKKYRENNKEHLSAYMRMYSAKRHATKLKAIPLWFEKEKVTLIYKKAQEWGFQVDHVIPLQGKNVCGLHCWANLQLLDKSSNASKGNREYPDH